MSKLILRKPFVGHGLGTSLEANANYGTIFILPHNLYVELGIEIGLIGTWIFILFMKSIIIELLRAYSLMKSKFTERIFLLKCSESLLIILFMNIVFTFASYGLLVPVWYFLGGLIVVLRRMSAEQIVEL
jgi:O-antigen ligase